MSTFWIHRESGTVAIDDAVLKGVDTSSLPKNVQLVWWYGTNGEIRYTDDDRIPIREPVTDLEPYIQVFNKWILAAKTPLPTTSGKTMPGITLAQAKAVKIQLTRGLYYNKFSPGSLDNTAAVNASIQTLVQSTNAALQNLTAQVNGQSVSQDGARAADAAALNASGSSQATGINANFGALSGFTISIPSGGGSASLPGMGGIGPVSMSTTPVGGNIGAPGVYAPGIGVGDPLAAARDSHISNINAQTTVDGVAAYDITAGW